MGGIDLSLCSWVPGQYPPRICVENRITIQSCVLCLGKVELAVTMFSKVKSQRVSSILKTQLDHEYLVVNSVAETLHHERSLYEALRPVISCYLHCLPHIARWLLTLREGSFAF